MNKLEETLNDLPLAIRFAETRSYNGIASIMRDALSLLKAQESKWINVENKLPESTGEYIVHIIDDKGNWAIGIAEWDYTLGIGIWRIGLNRVMLPDGMYITHWTKTPEPPKEEGTMRNWRNDPVTDKQLNMIFEMQENAGMNGAIPLPPFNGLTKGEAFDYIQANIHKQYEAFDYAGHEDNYGDRI